VSGAQSEEEEAAKGKEREGGGLAGGIKKKKQRRWVKGAASQVHRQAAARREQRSEHARQLSPALPLGCESEPSTRGLTIWLWKSSSTRHQALSPPLPSPPCLSLAGAARLLRGGAPRRLLAAASPDPRVVRRGHSSFPPARGQQYCIRGRHRPRARSLCARSAWTGEPRQAGPGRRAGACLSARGEVAQAETPCDTTVWSER
jgi:hypothetical protein